jgi:hypothetical protein
VRPNRIVQSIVVAAALPLLFLADVPAHAPFGLGLARTAHAIVGAPLTPVSVAGVARRTTRRVVVAGSAAAAGTAAAQSSTAATAQQQQAVAQQQAATAQQQAATAAAQAGTPAIGSVVSVLPAGCVPVTQGGVAYQKCGSVYYRSAFQGNNLVYVVQQP